jgi:proline iminopeptidase
VRVAIEPGTRLFVDVVGSSLAPTDEEMVERPTLLLLHGGPGFDHSSFRPYFDRFADTHQVVYLDHRGQGRSDGHDDPQHWNLDTWADDVARCCEALDIEQPVILGNSFGGFVAIRAAARHRGLASKLVLSSTQARRHLDVTAARFEALGGVEARDCYLRVFGDDATDDPDAWVEYAQHCMPLYNVVASSFGAGRARMNLAVLADFTRTFGEFDVRADLAAIRCPTLVLVGDDDPMTPVEAAQELVALLPAGVARLQRFADCGHGTFRDRPGATERVLREFLA